jgi:hypothetical protein
MRSLDDKILAEAYTRVLESHPDPTYDPSEEELTQDNSVEAQPEPNREHPELSVFGQGSKKPDAIVDSCQRYITNLKDILANMNHDDLEQTYWEFNHQAGLLYKHAEALDAYASELFSKRQKEIKKRK